MGISEFKAQGQGTKYGAYIKSIKDSEWGRGKTLKLKLKLSHYKIKSIKLFNEEGKEIKYEETSTSYGMQNRTEYGLTVKRGFPAKGKIIAEIYSEPKKQKGSFKIRNITLLGFPRE